MKTRRESIGSFEAKTHLSSLIDNVQKGAEYIITKRGRPVAKLTAYTGSEAIIKMEEIILQFDSIRKSIKGKVDIKELINQGRKY